MRKPALLESDGDLEEIAQKWNWKKGDARDARKIRDAWPAIKA
ncbi:MAG: hypothetical protein METHAR1v1_1360004 [Methanothrix sp.]|jgi:hypothetical protein|nr:MAG: hypothetical protein METHAR1v1_1360004 [Methanothrix sp.]